MRLEESSMSHPTSRRDFLALLSTASATALLPSLAIAQRTMPTRRVPVSGENLPVIGLGSSKVVEEIARNGEEPVRQVLRALAAQGGKVIDTWPRNPANDARFGGVINTAEFRERLFITSKIDRVGKDAGIAQFRQTQRDYGRKVIDLVQIFSLTDLDVHWPSLRQWKDAGEARYIGVTVSEDRRHADLEAFLKRERPDFMQTNYSITERLAEDRLLPLAADRGVAVVINRPFMNGAYFKRLEGKPLPGWAADFGCTSWAQFSLKYILAHPSVTCVLTETSNPKHMDENASTAFGPVPDEAARRRMREFIATV
jgi:diketogulonate reductase-like aldo/keto reductase